VIAKITRGSTFGGAVRYVLGERRGLDEERQPELIGGNMAGRTPAELRREFEAVRCQRPDVAQPVEHVALSFARDDRQLSNDEMAQLAAEYVERRGYDPNRCQYVVVRHYDRDHQHCHVLLNRVRTDRSLVPQQYREYLRSKETCRALEQDYGLSPVRNEPRRDRLAERAPTRGEDRMRRDRGDKSEKDRLKELVREAAQGRPSMSDFVARLEASGVQVRANIARTGHVSGISYRLDNVAVKGSRLGRAYSFVGLQREFGVRYDSGRDLSSLQRAALATHGQEPAWQPARGAAGRLARRLGGRLAARVPGVREIRGVSSLTRDLRNLTRSPGRAVATTLSRMLSPQQRIGLLIARTLVDLSRRR
jgi:hypothetical protein